MAYEILTANLPASEGLAVRSTVPMAELQDFFNRSFLEMAQLVRENDAIAVGPPFVRYYSVTADSADVETVITCDKKVEGRGRVRAIHLDASEAAIVRHVGRYDKMKPAYEAIRQWMNNNGKHATEAPREVYVTTIAEVPDPSEWVTLVEQPIA